MKKVTLKDIANELGVTVGTVSHVLNGIDDISEETKLRVLDAARRMGYISNGLAASLRSGKTKTVALIIPDISNPHLAYQTKLIEDKMREQGYSVIILNTNEDERTEEEAIRTACSRQVDGILLCPCQRSTQNVEFLKGIGLPFALIGRYFAELDADYICADDHKSGYLAGRFLVERGYRAPVFVGAYEYIEPGRNRFLGLAAAMSEVGVELDDMSFFPIDPIVNACGDVAARLEGVKFDSVVAFSDVIAFEITPQLRERYGRDLPVIGFDAISSHLPLPFYNVSVGMIGGGWAAKAADVIIAKIDGSRDTCRETIDVALFEFNK